MDVSRVARLAALAVLLVAAPSRAEEPRPAPARLPARVRLETPACARPPLDVDAFVRLLRIELREDAVAWIPDAAPEDDALATVTLAIAPCDPGTREISVGVASVSRRRGELRSVSIGDAPPSARPRLLALAVTELLRSLWPGLAAPTAPPVAPPPVAPPPVVAPPVRPPAPIPAPALAIAPPVRAPLPCPAPACPAEPRPARVHAWAGFEARTLIGSGSFAGGRAGAAIALSATVPIVLTLDAGALYGRAFDQLGTVDVVLASGALGFAGRIALGRAVVEVGPSIELGALWARGVGYEPATPASSGSALVVATSAEASIRGRLAERIWLDGALRGGAVLRGAALFADTREASAFKGAMLGIRAGAGVDF